MLTIEQWLEANGLEQYADLFRENAIDTDILPDLTDSDLRDFEIPFGDRKRLLKAIESLKAPAPTPGITGDMPDFSPELRQLTVMFCDLVDSTRVSTIIDPEELRDFLRDYQDTCIEVVGRYAGTVSRAYGDGLLIYFGYPVALENEASRAVLAAFDVIDAVTSIPVPPSYPADEKPAVRIGIHTGRVVVGGLRPKDWLDPMAVTGDTPNIAARLQGFAPINGIVVSPTTWKLCAGVAEFKTLGEQELKGLSEPMQLYQAVKPAATAAATALVRPTTAEHQLVLGRDDEINQLLTFWQGAEAAQPRAVFVSGAAGIGKSQLVQEFLTRLQDSDYRQIECRCSTLRLQSPFYPVIELLERTFQLQPGDSSDTRLQKTVAAIDREGLDKSKLIPLLAPLLSLASDSAYPLPELPPEQLRAMTVEALIQCMLLGQNNEQTLIIFEDLHWVDPSTREVITRLLAYETEHPLFILCTARPEFSVPWPVSPSAMHLQIAQLSADDSRKIIQALDADNVLHDDIVEHIVAKTDGVPLFVEELAKSLLEAHAHGELPERGSNERLNTTQIPATLQDSLLARLDRLGAAKKSAQLGATIGREFFYRILQKSSQLEAAVLAAHLDIILSAGLIFEKGESPDNRHVFKHALVQEAAYGMLIKSERQALHQRIAAVIEEDTQQSGVEQPEVLAHHHLEAGNTEAAIRYLHRAGERAVERHAVAEAIEVLQRGLEAIPTLPKSAQRHQLELKLHIAIAMPLASAGGYVAPELQHTLERAQVLCNELGNPPELFPVLHGLGKFYQAQADHDQVEALGVALLDMAQSTQDTAQLIEAHRSLGLCYSMTGEFDKCIAHNEEVLKRYTTEEHSSHVHLYAVDPSVVANSFIARALWAVGRIDESAECAEKSISHAIEIGHPYSETFALSSASTLYQLRDEPAKVAGYAAKAVEMATRHSFPFWLGWSAVPLGWAMCRLGKQIEGLATIEKGLAGYQQAGVDAGLPMRLATQAGALEIEGKFDEGQKLLERALALPATARDMYRGELHRLLARCLMHTSPDKTADIEHHLQQSIDWCEQHNAQTLLLRSLLTQLEFHADSKQQQVLDAVSKLYGKFDQGLDTPDLLAAKEVLESKPVGTA